VTAEGQLVAGTGDPGLVTFWRSAAKPFQALPLVIDGAVERFGLTDEELALACASHSSEPFHLELVDRFLAKVGLEERALACGPHPPLSSEVAREVVRQGIVMSARWSNCSGKHTGLLTLAKHHGWPLAGYERAGHPVQDRVIEEIERWTGVGRTDLVLAVDGCTTVCFGLPLRAMALGYARFGVSADKDARRLWRAITNYPELIAGTRRLCTDLMNVWPGEIFAKIGAEGVYSAAIPSLRLGVAIKVEDGDLRSVGVALIAIIRQVLERSGSHPDVLFRMKELVDHSDPEIRNTRGIVVGSLRAAGQLEFFGA
jgi:L-asparaginase II